MGNTYLYSLLTLKVIDDNVILLVKNNYTLKESELKFPAIDFDLNKVCNKLSIATGDYLKSPFYYFDNEIDDDAPIEYTILQDKQNIKLIPIFQKLHKEVNEFVYRLLVYKYNSIKRACHNYNLYNQKDLKITRKGYLRQLFNEYCLLRKQYFNSSYYKTNEFKNLNKIVVKLLYKYLFKD